MLALLVFSLKIGAVFSRGSVLSFFGIGLLVATASRVIVPRSIARLTEAHAYRGLEPIVVGVGRVASAKAFTNELRAQGCATIHFVDVRSDLSSDEWAAERRRVVAQVLLVARTAGRGMIYVLQSGIDKTRVAGIVSGLGLVPRSLFLVPDEESAELLRFPVTQTGTTLVLEIRGEPLRGPQRFVKRAIDIIAASLALIVLSPAMLAIAILVKLDSPGPALFRQVRNGAGGRPFRILKFRTMAVMEDGEDVRQAKAEGDPRVTRVGRWLRPTSLDELPQLVNVLRGEMSLVGPRPHAVIHDQYYSQVIENYEIRQHVKPGLTGWAQINGCRGETPTLDVMDRRIEFDLWYAANASLALDFLILLRTLPALIAQQGG
jgi:Undecaprenyl-phosphate glucose phosphotransferase